MAELAEKTLPIVNGVREIPLNSWEDFLPFIAKSRANSLIYKGTS
jgi:hypothetical protein